MKRNTVIKRLQSLELGFIDSDRIESMMNVVEKNEEWTVLNVMRALYSSIPMNSVKRSRLSLSHQAQITLNLAF